MAEAFTSGRPVATIGMAFAWTADDRGTGWLDQAACRRCDPELFFPDSDSRPARAKVEAAKKVCRRCPVRRICLSLALDQGQEAGIWGGTTEQERRQLLRRRSAPEGTAPVANQTG